LVDPWRTRTNTSTFLVVRGFKESPNSTLFVTFLLIAYQ
jgi:hypothetical protein